MQLKLNIYIIPLVARIQNMLISLSVTFYNSMVLEAFITHKNETSGVYDFKVDQK